jgi:hypothetical protein
MTDPDGSSIRDRWAQAEEDLPVDVTADPRWVRDGDDDDQEPSGSTEDRGTK